MKIFDTKSLKTILSAIVVSIIVLLTLVLCIVSYNSAFSEIEDAYLNQISNFNKDLDQQLSSLYDSQLKTASLLARNPAVVDAMASGDYGRATPILNSFYKELGIYEDVIMSTPQKNPEVKASGSLKANGIRWGGIGYDDNVEAALKGQSYVSNVSKSPATGLPVVLITAPIMRGEAVIGILGLSLDVHTFSQALVKDIKIGKTGYPYITSIDGMTFAHPKKEYIFKLNITQYDWGKEMMSKPDNSVVRYAWEGKDKIQVGRKNEKYRFRAMVTMYVSDVSDEARILAVKLVLFGLLGVIAAGAGVYFFIAKRLRPLAGCREVMNSMASGDLSKRYTDSLFEDEVGEIARSMNHSIDQFEKLVSEIIVASQNLAQAVEQIASGNQNLSQRTSEQASSLEEIASTIEEATATIKQNAENAHQANDMSVDTIKMADRGSVVVGEAVTSINEISDSGKKIGEIIVVINEIAFQTNLLALNAAVEAARAGEQGRGFAVVAGEVRNLAQRAGSAAKEIETLIKSSVDKVEKGTELVNSASSALLEVINAIRSVGQIISEIAASSEEQRQGIDQINLAVSEMDTMTQQNAALVEETASASEEMSNQAKELLAMMDRFTISADIRKAGPGIGRVGVQSKPVEKMKAQKAAGVRAKGAESAPRQQQGDIKSILEGEGFEEF